MTWTVTSGTLITQTNTNVGLSGLTGLAGVTTHTVGVITVYVVDTRAINVNGTLSWNPVDEHLVMTAGVNNLFRVNSSGDCTIGEEVTSAFGHGRQSMTPKQTGLTLAKAGGGTANGPLTLDGTLRLYGACVLMNGTFDINSGCNLIIRDAVIYSHNADNNTRLRCNEGAGMDIDGLEMYGCQFDWLETVPFTRFTNLLALDKGIPIENATGTQGLRDWRQIPDNTYGVDAQMNNWLGAHDVRMTLAEAGSRVLVAPDNTSAAFAHGGRLYHEFTVTCTDTLNAPVEGATCYLVDYDNGIRVTTTTGPTNISDGDQLLTPATASNGVTSLQTLLTAFFYRTNTVGDISTTDGQERTDYRGKPHVALCAITASSGVNATWTSSDSSLPNITLGTRFIVEGSSSNDTQTWETTEDWTNGTGGDAARLSGNSTNEAEQSLSFAILGADLYDLNIWSYNHLGYKFTDVSMKGLTAADLRATMLTDSAVTETNVSVVNAYTGIGDLEQLYDRAKAFKTTAVNLAIPDIDSQLITANGSECDLGDQELIVDGNASSAFEHSSGAITIYPVADPVITRVGVTEAISTGEADNITIAFPPGIQDDDVAYIIAGHAQGDENAWNTPSGWVIPSGLNNRLAGGVDPIPSRPSVTVFRRVLNSDSGSINITNVGTNTSGIVAQMVVYRNVDTSDPEDVYTWTGSGSGNPNPPSVTPNTDNSMILTIGWQDSGDQASPTAPTNYSLIADTATLDGSGTGEV